MPTATTNANAKHGAISTRKQRCALLQYVTSLTSAEHHPQIPPRRPFNLRQVCWRNGCGDGSPAGGQPAEISKARSGNPPTDVSAVFDELSRRPPGQAR